MPALDKPRRHLALPAPLWQRLDRLAHATGRRPGEQLRVCLERYFAALDAHRAGGAVEVDPTDAYVTR